MPLFKSKAIKSCDRDIAMVVKKGDVEELE